MWVEQRAGGRKGPTQITDVLLPLIANKYPGGPSSYRHRALRSAATTAAAEGPPRLRDTPTAAAEAAGAVPAGAILASRRDTDSGIRRDL